MGSKICKTCHLEKDFSEYGRSGKGPLGLAYGKAKEHPDNYNKQCNACKLIIQLALSKGLHICRSCLNVKTLKEFGGNERATICLKCRDEKDPTFRRRKCEATYAARRADPEKNRERQRELMRHYSETLHDTYIKIFLSMKYKLKFSEMTPGLIEAQRAVTRLQRAIADKLGIKVSTVGVIRSRMNKGKPIVNKSLFAKFETLDKKLAAQLKGATNGKAS